MFFCVSTKFINFQQSRFFSSWPVWPFDNLLEKMSARTMFKSFNSFECVETKDFTIHFVASTLFLSDKNVVNFLLSVTKLIFRTTLICTSRAKYISVIIEMRESFILRIYSTSCVCISSRMAKKSGKNLCKKNYHKSRRWNIREKWLRRKTTKALGERPRFI